MLARANRRSKELTKLLGDSVPREIIVRDEKGVRQEEGITITEQTVYGVEMVRDAIYQGFASTPAGKEAADKLLGWVDTNPLIQSKGEKLQTAIQEKIKKLWERGFSEI
jgi:hypothetical protein